MLYRRICISRSRARGHDDGRLGMALGDADVDAFLVVRAVAGERGEGQDRSLSNHSAVDENRSLITTCPRSDKLHTGAGCIKAG
jgi:hypothetical protein